jgi:eukaryotic-like serine/threonine-protein kinase
VARPPDDDALGETHAAGSVDATVASEPKGTSVVTKKELHPGPRRPPHSTLLDVDMDHYDVERELGRGGMGRILVARDRRLDREVALKLMRESAGSSLAARFEREARITARLTHPSIVPVYEAGRFGDGQPFYAMKLVSGRPLDAVLADARDFRDRLKLLPLLVSVCDALAYAHDRRVLHRDLKPQNILVGEFGEVVVIDWGLAKDLTDEAPEAPLPAGAAPEPGDSLTLHGEIMGTPAYMPPEQARGDAVDERADVYALGAILFRTLAGRAPFEGPSREIIALVQLGRAADQLPDEVPADLAAIVKQAMAPRAADRYPTAKELAADLRRFQEGQIVGVHRYTAWQLVARWVRRHRGAVTVGSAALAALLGLGVLAIVRIEAEKREAITQRERAVASQAIAEERAREATAQRTALLEEQGRQEILADRPFRALPYLLDAYALDPGSIAIRALLPEAIRPRDAEEVRLTGPGGPIVRVIPFEGDGVAYLTQAGAIRVPAGRVGADPPPGQRRVAALAPGGRRAAQLDERGNLSLYEGTRLTSLGLGGRPVDLVFFLSDDRLVVLDELGERVVDFASGKPLRVMAAGKTGQVSSVSVSGDGRLLAVARGVRAVVSDLETGRVVQELTHVPDAATDAADLEVQQPIRSLELDGTGTRILSVTRDDARLWRLGSGQELLRRAPEEAKVGLQFGAMAPDGKRALLARGDGIVHVWDLETGRVSAVLAGHGGVITAAAWRKDGREVATGSEDRTARVWDPEDGRSIALLGEHDGAVTDLAFAADGLRLYTASRDGSVRRFSLASRLLTRRGREDGEGDPGVDPAVAFNGEVVELWSTAGSRRNLLRGHHADVTVSSLEGKTLLTGSWDRTARVWDLGTPIAEPGAVLAMDGVVWVTSVAPDEKTAVVADEAGYARLFALPAGTRLADLVGPEKRLLTGGHSPDGRWVALGGEAGKVWIADAESGAVVRTIAAHDGWIKEIAWSPDSALVAVAELEGTAAVFRAADGTLVARLAGPASDTLAIAFSPDGRRLVTGTKSGTAAIHDVDSGRTEVVLEGHGAEVVRASFSPDGHRVVTACFDGTARLWDARTGRILARLAGDGDPLRTARFFHGGTRVITTTTFGTTRIWDTHLETRDARTLKAR